jgi:hypothetical protein
MKWPAKKRSFGCAANALPVWSAPGRLGAAGAAMTPVVRVCAIASALLAAGCSSWMPSWDFIPSSLSSGANVSLTIESDPPGADAKTSLGPSCRTPCMIPVPADRAFTVNYSLNGYLPQVIQVGPRGADVGAVDVAGAPSETYGTPSQPEVAPNPVYAQLQLAPPPAPVKKKGKARPKQPPKQ